MAALTLFSAVTATNELASLGQPLMWQVPARLTAQILATIAVWRFIRQPQADIIERDRLLELLDEWGARVRERERERSRNQLLDLIEERLTDPRGVPQVRKQDPPRR